MKKTYCKPQIAFESFELTSSIAAGCAIPANHNDQKSTMGVKVCYDIPTWDTVLFTS